MSTHLLDHVRVLDVLLRTRSPSAAARELGVTQSAVSKALARLRTELQDPLLVRRGDQMILTPRAQRLATPLAASLNNVRRVLAASETQTRPSSVAVAMRDQFVLALAPALLRGLTAENSALNVIPYDRERLADDLARGTVDLAVAVDPPDAPDLVARVLYRETFVCLTPDRSPPSLHEYLKADHVATTAHSGYVGIDAALARKGYKRRISAHVPYFAALVHVAESQGLYATLPGRVVEALQPKKLFQHPVPVAIPGFRVSMVWHRRCMHDRDNQWLRGLMVAAAGQRTGRS